MCPGCFTTIRKPYLNLWQIKIETESISWLHLLKGFLRHAMKVF